MYVGYIYPRRWFIAVTQAKPLAKNCISDYGVAALRLLVKPQLLFLFFSTNNLRYHKVVISIPSRLDYTSISTSFHFNFRMKLLPKAQYNIAVSNNKFARDFRTTINLCNGVSKKRPGVNGPIWSLYNLVINLDRLRTGFRPV